MAQGQSRRIVGAGTTSLSLLAFALALALVLLAPARARAHGGHDKVGCRGCHAALQGKSVLDVAPNTKVLDPRTGKPFTGATAFCLTCHLETEKGGKGHLPVSRHNSHPFALASVNARVARVPPDLISRDGQFDCMGCHDPHPSNRNYKYVRADVGASGERMDRFCAVCHPAKTDPSKAPAASIAGGEGDAEAAPAKAPAAAPAKAPASAAKPGGK